LTLLDTPYIMATMIKIIMNFFPIVTEILINNCKYTVVDRNTTKRDPISL